MKKLNSILLIAMLFFSVCLMAQSKNDAKTTVEPVVKTAIKPQQKIQQLKSNTKKNLKTTVQTANAKKDDLADRLLFKRTEIPYRIKK